MRPKPKRRLKTGASCSPKSPAGRPAWYHLWNMRDEDIAKLMNGVTKSGVLEAEAKPGQ
jgi:hypothetical protein